MLIFYFKTTDSINKSSTVHQTPNTAGIIFICLWTFIR